MYVDESGDPGYPEDGGFPRQGGPTRYYVRAGVIVHGWKCGHVNQMIVDFKLSRGLTWDQEIKAKHIRRGKMAFAEWSREDRRQFLLDLLDSIGLETDISILTVAIAKERVDRLRRERYTNPTVRSLELLLERYNMFLSLQRDRSGIVILDATESKADEGLRYFQNYLRQFSDHLDARRIVEGALFMPSHTTNLLQVADVCANVVYAKFASADGNQDEYKRIAGRVFAEKVWPS